MRIITVCRLYCTNVQYAGAVGTPRTSGHCSRLVAFRAGIVSCQPTWHHPRFRGSWVMVMALAAMHAKYVQPPNQEPEGRKDTYCSAAGGTATTVLPPLKKAILWRCTRAPFLVCTARLLLFFFLGGGGGGGGAPQGGAYAPKMGGVSGCAIASAPQLPIFLFFSPFYDTNLLLDPRNFNCAFGPYARRHRLWRRGNTARRHSLWRRAVTWQHRLRLTWHRRGRRGLVARRPT
jgi:hypothetical protein